jgi:hypothetical protein
VDDGRRATIRSRATFLIAITVGAAAVALMVTPSIAGATHPRPKGATPLRVAFVPAYNACTAPNRTHGPPLAFPSCNPPVQSSSFLTVGTPDANGAAANFVGSMTLTVIPPTCCPPEYLYITGSVSDVRCKGAAQPCGSANSNGGPDYTGELQSDSTIRITDHNSGPNADEPATVVDIPFPVTWSCASTADPSIGAKCTISTSAVALGAPSGSAPARMVAEISQLKLFDGGADGINSTTPNTLFAVQGLFIP